MTDDKQLPDHLENVPERPIDPDRVLSDDELQAGGLQPVKAYVRTKASKAADRQKRWREKKSAEGLKQTNVQVPEEHQDTIKEIARRLREGEPVEAVPAKPQPLQVVPEAPAQPKQEPQPEKPTPASDEPELTEADRKVLLAARGRGLRSWLVRRLAGA